jgi:hypothetical protein
MKHDIVSNKVIYQILLFLGFLLISSANSWAFGFCDQEELFLAVEKDQVQNVELLIEEGCDFSIRNKEGNSLIHKAIYHQSIKSTQYLLKLGASLETINHQGQTPLMVKSNFEMSKVLKAHLRQ